MQAQGTTPSNTHHAQAQDAEMCGLPSHLHRGCEELLTWQLPSRANVIERVRFATWQVMTKDLIGLRVWLK